MKSKNILIVEDKEHERKLFEYLISQLHVIQSFDNCKDALANLANQRPNLILISLLIEFPAFDAVMIYEVFC